jgi:TolB protein
MKKSLFLSLLFLACYALGADAPRQIAFERDSSIWVANLDGTGAKKLTGGVFPSISSDGTRVAFNTVEKNGNRHIAVIAIATGETKVFHGVPGDNSFGPVFSPDGSQIVFLQYDGSVWSLCLINSDGTGFHFLKKPATQGEAFYSPAWASDGKSIFCQDMFKIYHIGLDGASTAQWEIQKVIPNGDMSSSSRITVSPDGQRLLLGIDMGEEAHRKGWEGPLPAVWTLDLATQKSVRLTPKSLFGWDGCWLDSETILFISQAAGEKQASLYRMPLGGKDRKLVIKNAGLPTVSQ